MPPARPLQPLTVLSLAACLVVAGCRGAYGEAPPGVAPWAPVTGYAVVADITDRALPEISGLAVSRRDPERIWALNDGGNPAELRLLATDGRTLAIYHLAGVRNVDWEDLAAFEFAGIPYLLVADIGDNYARRKEVRLHLFEEPEVPPGGLAAKGELRPRATLRFRYPSGPRDAESVAVDAAHGDIFVLTKREEKPIFHRLPLRLESPDEVLLAEEIGRLKLDEPRFGAPGGPVTRSLFGASPTAIDLDAESRDMLLLTYTAVYRLQRETEESWKQALNRPANWLADHPLPHAEALAVDPSGSPAWFTSERLPAPLYRLDLDPGR